MIRMFISLNLNTLIKHHINLSLKFVFYSNINTLTKIFTYIYTPILISLY